MKKHENLFSPGKINTLTLRNRIIMPPMGTFMNHLSGETPEKLIEMFARRARGGAAASSIWPASRRSRKSCFIFRSTMSVSSGNSITLNAVLKPRQPPSRFCLKSLMRSSLQPEVLWQQKPVGASAVIIGGSEVGCETALYLLKQGVKVTILEMLPRVVPKMNAATRNCLVKELTDGGAVMVSGAVVTAVEKGKVIYRKDGREETAEADTVVLAVGAQPLNGLYQALQNEVMNLHVIGDARKPRLIMEAVREGFFTAYYLYAKLLDTCK